MIEPEIEIKSQANPTGILSSSMSEPKKRSAYHTKRKIGCKGKKIPTNKGKVAQLEVFKGREQRLNRAIFQVLSEKSPLAVWDILQHIIHDLKGFKRTKYAITNARIKALATQGYLRTAGIRVKRQGGSTNLYELTARAKLAMAISTKSIDDIINGLDEDSAQIVLQIISK